jgi:phage gp46-like protein
MAEYGNNFDYGMSPLYKDEGSVYIPPVPPNGFEDDLSFEGDIKIVPDQGIINCSDIQVADRDLLRDAGFETAILVSLFTDRRADPDDVLPDNTDDKSGWWGDTLNEENDKDGSRIWLVGRSKNIPDILPMIEGYIIEALQWMIDDQIASTINVSLERRGMSEVTISLEIVRPIKSETISYKYYYNWEYQKIVRAA